MYVFVNFILMLTCEPKIKEKVVRDEQKFYVKKIIDLLLTTKGLFLSLLLLFLFLHNFRLN